MKDNKKIAFFVLLLGGGILLSGFGSQKLGFPLKNKSFKNMSSPFGWRIDPISGKNVYHNGVDIPAFANTELLAPADSIVYDVNYNQYGGNQIVFKIKNNLFVSYSHLNKVLAQKGQRVVKGQVVGLVGSTGYSTGPHLHLSVLVNGEYTNPINYF